MKASGVVLFFWAALAWAADCNRTATRFFPLDYPFQISRYAGESLGLYPNGANKRPAAHEAAGLRLAAEVQPRNASGAVDAQNGRIVLLAIGMSNTTQEFSAFQPLANRDPEKNPAVLLVDGAQGGWSADRIVAAGGEQYWTGVDTRLSAAGATAAQVQVVWMKQADAGPTLPFPSDARKLQGELAAIARTLRARFPNLRLLYLSSRTYAGYASTTLNPEPYAYQSGFAVRWLIEQQLSGDPALSYDAGQAPWLSWGPYLWVDGTQMRADGMAWNCSDFADDGTHPAATGREKVARLLLDFFKSDTTARTWFVRASAAPAAPSPAALVNAAGYLPQVAPGAIATLFGGELAGGTASAAYLPLPHTLAGTRVEIGGRPAPLFYASPGQINLLVPPGAADGTVEVFRGTRSATLKVDLWNGTALGIFTTDATGRGPAAALHADGRPVTTADPARPGEALMLFCTGLGVLDPRLARPTVLPSVIVGGQPATILFVGQAPGFPGLDQINFVAPGTTPAGTVPVQINSIPVLSNTATLAVN
jgi:uncharacterized protein (TIGR03437 family)